MIKHRNLDWLLIPFVPMVRHQGLTFMKNDRKHETKGQWKSRVDIEINSRRQMGRWLAVSWWSRWRWCNETGHLSSGCGWTARVHLCLLHPLGLLGFVKEPNIPACWLNDRKWAWHPASSFCHPHIPLRITVWTPFHFIIHLSRSLSSSWLTLEEIAGQWVIPAWVHAVWISW